MVDYNNFGGSNGGNNGGNNGSDDDNVTLKITTYAALEGTLETAFSTGSQWGQSLGWVMSNVVVVDGALYDRGDGTYKVFSWKDLGFTDDMDYTSEDAPRVTSESFGTNDYSYELIDARADESGEDKDPIEVGDAIIFDGASEYGPSATSKTTARTLTNLGRDAILDEDSQDEWLDDSVELRSDLEDVRIRYFKVRESGEENDFNLPVFQHKRLGERIKIDNKVSTSSSGSQEGGSDALNQGDEPNESGSTGSESDGPFPAPVQEFITFCRDEDSVDDEDGVEMMLNAMVDKPDNDMTEEMVDPARDDIITAALEA